MITIKKNQRGFTQIDNYILNDTNLSMQAIGLFTYLWSKPNDWQYYKEEIMKRFNCGKEALNTALKLLENNGYIYTEQTKDANGRFNKLTWHLCDKAEAKTSIENQQTENRLAEKPLAENRLTENQHLLIYSNNKTNLTNTNLTNTNNIGKAKNFQKPTLKELQDYIETREVKIDAIKFLDYYDSNGWKVGKNPMKNWQATVRTWESNINQHYMQNSSKNGTSGRLNGKPDHRYEVMQKLIKGEL